MRSRRVTLVALVLCLAAASSAAAQTLNMSHDLVRLGIASRDIAPNDPTLDARPLFQAATNYVRTNGIRTLTWDPGAYYFLTPQFPYTYLVIADLVDVTIDLAGATLYFSSPRPNGLQVFYCQRVTLTNFTTDYINTPYTHTQLTSVDGVNRRLHYAPMTGWFDPVVFAADATPSEVSTVVALVFRGGEIVPGTTRMPVQAIGSGRIDLFQNTAPWTQGPTLSTFRPGDVLVVTYRGGGPPVMAWFCDEVVFSHIRIFGAGTWALSLEQTSNSVVEYVRIEPRPGGLIGSTADGIHFRHDLRNNHIRNCYVTRTVDDGLILDSLAIATLVSQTGPRTLTVRRDIYTRFPNGTRVGFVDPATAMESSGGVIVSQNPPDSRNTEFNGLVTLTLDADVSPPTGATLVFADADMRGSGSTIEDNVVENVPFGRGIWIGGSIGVSVRRNVVRTTSSGGITVYQATVGDPGPPVRDLLIHSNVLEGNLGPAASGTGTQTSTASLIVVSTASEFRFAPSAVNSNVAVRANYIVDSGRSAIWTGETNGAVIENNFITRWYQRPQLPIWGIPPDLQEQVYRDFPLPIALRHNSGIIMSGNDVRPFSNVTAPVSFATPTVVVPGSGGASTVAVTPVISSFEWRAASPDAWITVSSAITTGAGVVSFSVTPNPGVMARSGRVLVAGQSITVVQAANAALATPGHTALAPAVVNGNTVTLDWSAAVGGAPVTSFTIVASLTPGGPPFVSLNAGAVQSATVAAPSGVFYVRVLGSNAAGNGPLSNEVVVVVGAGAVPLAPQNLTAMVGTNQFNLAWTAPANFVIAPIESFVIEAGSAPGLSNLASFATGSTDMQFVSPTVPNGSYFVRVRARNGAGLGPPSNDVRIVIGPLPPSAPVLSGSVMGGAVSLSWTAPSSGAEVTGYQLQAGTAPGTSNAAILTLPVAPRSFSASDVPPGRYYVRIVALSGQGPSDSSNEVVLEIP